MTARARLAISLVLVAVVAAIEFWGGLRANSLALITDALHVCADVFTLAIALLAILGAQRPANTRKTFGYGRLEVVAAMLNGSLLLAATAFIVYEAVRRFMVPQPESGALMTEIAAIGLAMNVIVGALLMHRHERNLNVQAALFHVAGDALGALAVIVGGVIIAATRAYWIDPALALFVAAIVLAGVTRIMRDALDVLLEAAPRGINLEAVRAAMTLPAGIVAVHDLHVWTIGSGDPALSAHVLIADKRVSEASAILREVDALLRGRFGVRHVTLQFECENCQPDERIVCTQPPRDEHH